jgi:uncharacterized protein
LFTWDESKRLSNIDKHGIDFADICEEFFQSALTVPAKRERFKALGRLGAIVMAAVIFERRGDDIRIISARTAHRSERK